MVANVSLVRPAFAAANPAPRWNLLDRYLVIAEAMDLPSIICITKLDLIDQSDDDDTVEFHQRRADFQQRIAEYLRIGYPVYPVSAASGEGLDALQTALRGQITVMLGKSGVGKSTLLNALQPGLNLRVGDVSQMTGKGKHTTTYLEMYPLDSGGAMIDTPGMREFGLWDIPADDLALFFPEMRPWVGQCRFGSGCRHDEEPGCAVRKAVVTGKISPHRYQSYLRMREDSEDEI
jgi:ribosome biogenesis GTPase